MSITRTAIVDDDGTGTTGTVLNNAWKQELYDQIDEANGPGLPSALTTHALLLGRGTSTVAAAATGSAGDLVTSGGASADPAWFTPFASAAYRSSNQTISTAAFTALSFDTNVYDRGTVHSTGTNPTRFTVPTGGAGIYLASAFCLWAGSATGQRQILVKKNGTTALATDERAGSAVFNAGSFVTFPVLLADGDYLEFFVYQDSGGNLDVLGGQASCSASVTRLTPT